MKGNIKNMLNSNSIKSFRPFGSESRLVKQMGLNRVRHSSQSAINKQFSQPGTGFSMKDIITTTPQQRQEYGREMRKYQQELSRQTSYTTQLARLSSATIDTEAAYKSLKAVENRKISSIDDLKQATLDSQKYSLELQNLIKKVNAENAAQTAYEKEIARKTTASASRSSRSSKRVLKPTETINFFTGQIVNKATGRVIASPANPTNSQLKAMTFLPKSKTSYSSNTSRPFLKGFSFFKK